MLKTAANSRAITPATTLLTARSAKAQIQLAVVTGCVLVPAFHVWIGGLGIVVVLVSFSGAI